MATGAIRNRFVEEVASGLVLGRQVGIAGYPWVLMVREMSSQYMRDGKWGGSRETAWTGITLKVVRIAVTW